MTSNWQGLLVSGDPWMASVHKLALQSLQIGSTETSQSFQRKRNTETLHMLLNPLSVTPFQGVSQMGTSLPCLSKFGLLWFCSCGEEGWKRYRRYWRGAWKTGEMKAGKTALPSSEWPFIKGGLLLKQQRRGGKETKALNVPKRDWTGTSVSLLGTTQNETTDLEKITHIAIRF